eukprot:scaffold4459_cov75-Cylindrotheca_fusiformis.AAC.1
MTLICGTSDLGRMKAITIRMLDTVSSHQPWMCCVCGMVMTNKTKKLIDQATGWGGRTVRLVCTNVLNGSCGTDCLIRRQDE